MRDNTILMFLVDEHMKEMANHYKFTEEEEGGYFVSVINLIKERMLIVQKRRGGKGVKLIINNKSKQEVKSLINCSEFRPKRKKNKTKQNHSIHNMNSSSRKNNPATSPNRSVSPIHYVKPSSVYYANTISPTKSAANSSKKSAPRGLDLSPNRNLSMVQNDEVDLWKSRCNELETSLCQVNTDLELAAFKAKKAKDLEGKVDDILKQNAQLLGENDQLSKQFSQKRTESDIWKSKYDAQMNMIITLKANYENDNKRLLSDLAQQRELNDLLQQEKRNDALESKQQLLNDNHIQIESLKRSHCSNITLYEEQNRKMRDDIEERDKEIRDLQNKLSESKNYSDSESNRLNEDKERLRMRIQQMELDQSKELENQKRRSESLGLEQTSALKKLHESELDVLESELSKLKNLLELKNQEIQTLIQQNKSQKRNFECELQAVRDENEALKDKILENNRMKEEEIEDIQNKLAKLHTTDIQNLKNHHDNQINTLSNENNDLKSIISLKNDEIENQLREKMNQRESYNAEVDRLNSEIETLKLKWNVLNVDRQREYEESQDALNRANTAHTNFANQQNSQAAFLTAEIEKLKQLLVHKNNEIDVHLAQHRTVKANLEEDLRQLKLAKQDLKTKMDNLEHQKNLLINELKNKLIVNDNIGLEKTKKFEAQIDYLENELKRTRENYQVKSEESNNHSIHRGLLETENKKLNEEIDGLTNHVVALEKMKAQEINDLRQKLESSNKYTIDQINNSHYNQIQSLNSENDDLKYMLETKDRQLSEKADQYQNLQRTLSEIKENSTDPQEYQQRISKLGADFATNNNLYEVFAKVRQPTGSGKKIMPNNVGVSPFKRVNQFE